MSLQQNQVPESRLCPGFSPPVYNGPFSSERADKEYEYHIQWYSKQAHSLLEPFIGEFHDRIFLEKYPLYQFKPNRWYYAVTLKYNTGCPNLGMIYSAIRHLAAQVRGIYILNLGFEIGKQRSLHVHFGMWVPKKITFYAAIKPLQGWHQYFSQIYDFDGWVAYCTKQCFDINEAKTILASTPYYSNRPMFRETHFSGQRNV